MKAVRSAAMRSGTADGARVFIGTSGWNYRDWAGGTFYPAGLPASKWLEFFAQRFDTVEINNTFYRLPERRVFERWREATPDDFVFTIKASRFITHMKKLAEPREHVGRFLRRARGLGTKLGVALFQLPPFWRFNRERLAALCSFLTRQGIVRGARFAVEVRHASWLCEPCFEILRKHNVALALTDWPGLPVKGPVTADFLFVRRHGPGRLYPSGYSSAMLRRDSLLIESALDSGRDAFAYFNNDALGHAIRDALGLKKLVTALRKRRRRPAVRAHKKDQASAKFGAARVTPRGKVEV